MSTVVVGLDDWELWQHGQRLSTVTVSERVRVLRAFYEETQVQPVSAGPLDISRWLADHADDWSDSTACAYTSYLASWFKWLQIVDRRADNPMIKVGTPKAPDRVPRPIADSDVPVLLAARMWSSTRSMILLALLAGLRVSEIARVRGQDVDLPARLLWVKGKGRRVRSIPMHPLLIELASTMPATGYWFPMRGHPNEPMHSKSVSDVIRLTMRRAGVRGTPHCLRHWYATSLLDDGNDIRVVQELMRHKSIQSTQMYTRVSNERQREAIAALSLGRYRQQISERHARAADKYFQQYGDPGAHGRD
ncbi:tyrosine-type recombinase/integrase [Mycobacterium hackensackense]|uniref:tyrosine-type recombinase/integrase n=1 Tax=Mycobacterium hackensackense TaxID=228909 RepID=UPI00226594D7|nr:tyrosine-type recombinase/integrase [Mycobacterium hackensackense]MCV7251220.1 tyrosine-type recombinase/integrase [Mycobacterium hackensackense]